MRRQTEILATQEQTSEAIALSLETKFVHPHLLYINVKNEGKGLAHNPKLNYSILDDQKVVFSNEVELQPIGAGSKQDTLLDFYEVRVPDKAKLRLEWKATASDSRVYNGTYEIHYKAIPIADSKPE